MHTLFPTMNTLNKRGGGVVIDKQKVVLKSIKAFQILVTFNFIYEL